MKNKKILITSIVIIIIIALIIGILYLTTDLFKTNQQLFYKYFAQVKVMDSEFINQSNIVEEKISKNSNSSTMNIDFLLSIKNEETGIADIQKLFSIKSNGLKNVLSNQEYRDFTLSSNEQNLLTLKYIREDNTYAIGADNILAKYLAVENANLKELFSKLGVQDLSQVPDSIPTSYEEILQIDEATLNKLKQTYGTLIYNNINKENYYKVTNEDKTEIIGVSLTEQEVINILKVILETAKTDNTLLNLIVSKAQLLNYNNLTVENIQSTIQEYIDTLTNGTYSTDKDFIKISLIKKDKNIIGIDFETNYKETISENIDTTEQTEPTSGVTSDVSLVQEQQNINNKYNITIDLSEQNKIVISMKENDTELIKETMQYSYDNSNINFNFEIEANNGEETNISRVQYQINNYQTDNIVESLIIDTTSQDDLNSYQINLSNNITIKQDVQIEKLTTENSAKLNDMTAEELSQLFTALGNRIMTLYGGNLTNLYSNSIMGNMQDAQEEYQDRLEEENEIIQNYENSLTQAIN